MPCLCDEWICYEMNALRLRRCVRCGREDIVATAPITGTELDRHVRAVRTGLGEYLRRAGGTCDAL